MQKHVSNYLKHFKLGEQDTWQCEACGRVRPINNGLQIHHIKYRSRMGNDSIQNCICLCVKCHTMAHNEELSESDLLYIHRAFLSGQRNFMK